MGCCKDDEGCCAKTKQERSCCVCHPYSDPVLVSAQILSVVAFCVSWFWWVTLILGCTAMILLQVMWCCRMKRAGFVASIIIAGSAALGSFAFGIYAIVAWQGDTLCNVFVLAGDDDFIGLLDDDDVIKNNGGGTSSASTSSSSTQDYCNEVAWAVVAFVTGTMWAATAACIFHFMRSGRYAQCEEADRRASASAAAGLDDGPYQHGRHSSSTTTNAAVEMGVMMASAASASATGPPETVAVLSEATADAYPQEKELGTAIPAASYVFTDDHHYAGGYDVTKDDVP